MFEDVDGDRGWLEAILHIGESNTGYRKVGKSMVVWSY